MKTKPDHYIKTSTSIPVYIIDITSLCVLFQVWSNDCWKLLLYWTAGYCSWNHGISNLVAWTDVMYLSFLLRVIISTVYFHFFQLHKNIPYYGWSQTCSGIYFPKYSPMFFFFVFVSYLCNKTLFFSVDSSKCCKK